MISKTFNVRMALLTLITLITLNGCFYDEGITEPIPEETIISYSLDIQPLFNTHCISCHPLIATNPDLTKDNSYEAITSDNYIVPNNLEASILYQKLMGKPDIMPPSGPLPQKDIDLVKKWIEQGALNN